MSKPRMLTGACALLAALVVAAPAQARMINTTFDVPSETNNCVTGETVVYTQTYHVVAKTEVVDGEEQLVWSRFDLREAQGVGVDSGDHYQIKTKSISNESPIGAAQPLTLVAQFQVIDTGSGANCLVGEVFHTTYNANGELTVWNTQGNVRIGDFHDHVGVKL
jgi:hypothetical protein